MNWTTEYPTKPGFYWIRNYEILGKSETIMRSERSIAHIVDGLAFWLFQWPEALFPDCVVKAEWQGPIEPDYSISKPQYELFSETTCAECLGRSNRFISWPLGEVDGKPRFGLICRECWIKRLTPEQRKVYMV